jgi:hypothetical protein
MPIYNNFTISIDLGQEFHKWFPQEVQPNPVGPTPNPVQKPNNEKFMINEIKN